VKRTIVCLGEGDSDCDSLPTLLTRVAEFLGEEPPILQEPIRFRRNRVLKDELSRLLGLARKKLRTPGGVLIVLDADEDCPAELGPSILLRASELSSDMPVAAVVAKRMFESWVIAGAEGLISEGEVNSKEVPPDPESVRSPKQWLSARIKRDDGYGEMADLKRLTGCFSIEHAHRRSPSFRKLCKEVARLLGKGA
jgi:hypothetical protein